MKIQFNLSIQSIALNQARPLHAPLQPIQQGELVDSNKFRGWDAHHDSNQLIESFADFSISNHQSPIPHLCQILIMSHNNKCNSMVISELKKYFHNFFSRI